MVAPYGVIANGGQFVEPTIVRRIEDRTGQVLVEFHPVREAMDGLPKPQALA